jgi:serine/threonine-protein kinase
VAAILTSTAPPLTEVAPWAPPQVAALVARALERTAARRFRTAQEMLDAVRALLPKDTKIREEMLSRSETSDAVMATPALRMAARGRARIALAAGAAVAAVAVVGTTLGLQPNPTPPTPRAPPPVVAEAPGPSSSEPDPPAPSASAAPPASARPVARPSTIRPRPKSSETGRERM